VSAQQKNSFYTKIGFSLFEPIDDDFRDYYPMAIGYKIEGGKYISKEVRAGIGVSWYGKGKDNYGYKDKLSLGDILANIEWVPTGVDGKDWFSIGLSAKMRYMKIKYEDGDEWTGEGFGFSPRIGSNIFLSENVNLFLELEYELIKDSDDYDIGGVIFTIGIKIK